jgi:hypothetical protein
MRVLSEAGLQEQDDVPEGSHAAWTVGGGHFKDFLCDVDGDESIVLHGMGSFLAWQQRLWHTMPIESSEESIPSMQPTKLRAAGAPIMKGRSE